MTGIAEVTVVGNLTAKPLLRHTKTEGKAVVNFTVAVNRRFRDGSDGIQEDKLFLPVTAFGGQAVICEKFLDKGSPVLVLGILQNHTWTNKDNQQATELRVLARTVKFLSRHQPPNGATAEETPTAEIEPAEEPQEAAA